MASIDLWTRNTNSDLLKHPGEWHPSLVISQSAATAPLCHGRHAPGFFQAARMPRPNNSIFRNPSLAVALLVVDTLLKLLLLALLLTVSLLLSCFLCISWRPHLYTLHSIRVFSQPHSRYYLSLLFCWFLWCYFLPNTRALYKSNSFICSSVVIDVFIFLSNAVHAVHFGFCQYVHKSIYRSQHWSCPSSIFTVVHT